ncbi:unnamed protein product [Pleuronectes platessa]|uniref:Uncharacterized protein n=1 Tax=Pleuronectes platessa TaxID=8262 RepID=A0A9N7VVA8_PLEPL|nr:unnamed protein product [Pleuronectes platessa]
MDLTDALVTQWQQVPAAGFHSVSHLYVGVVQTPFPLSFLPKDRDRRPEGLCVTAPGRIMHYRDAFSSQEKTAPVVFTAPFRLTLCVSSLSSPPAADLSLVFRQEKNKRNGISVSDRFTNSSENLLPGSVSNSSSKRPFFSSQECDD